MKSLLILLLPIIFAACTHAPKKPAPCPKSEIQALKEKGLKRLQVWNKKQFEQPAGGLSIQSIKLLAIQKALGGQNVEPMSHINGFTIDVPLDKEPTVSALANSDWVVEPVVEYKIVDQLYKIVPADCPPPSNPPPVQPPPVQPPPVNPPNEVAKSWGITRVGAIEAKALVNTSNVKVGILDTGIDASHPYLQGRVKFARDYTGRNNPRDGNGHGTHVAGTIAGLGGIGVSEAQLYIGKGLSDSGSGRSDQLANGGVDLCNQGIHIMNNSWGAPSPDQMTLQMVRYCASKGVNVFIANGNDGGPVNWPAKDAPNSPNVFAVASSDQNDRISNFSSRGPETKVIAPGSDIISSVPGGGLRSFSGTSMATPHAAGVCAFGVAKGIKPCIKPRGSIGGYPFAHALETAQ